MHDFGVLRIAPGGNPENSKPNFFVLSAFLEKKL
jgi:hypothetical protein